MKLKKGVQPWAAPTKRKYDLIDEDDEEESTKRKVCRWIHPQTLADSAQLPVDNNMSEVVEALKEKYPVGSCKIHPTDHCFSTQSSVDHWLLDRPKLMVWVGTIVGTRCPFRPHMC